MDIIPHFNKEIHVYVRNLSKLWSPLKNKMSKDFIWYVLSYMVWFALYGVFCLIWYVLPYMVCFCFSVSASWTRSTLLLGMPYMVCFGGFCLIWYVLPYMVCFCFSVSASWTRSTWLRMRRSSRSSTRPSTDSRRAN